MRCLVHKVYSFENQVCPNLPWDVSTVTGCYGSYRLPLEWPFHVLIPPRGQEQGPGRPFVSGRRQVRFDSSKQQQHQGTTMDMSMVSRPVSAVSQFRIHWEGRAVDERGTKAVAVSLAAHEHCLQHPSSMRLSSVQPLSHGGRQTNQPKRLHDRRMLDARKWSVWPLPTLCSYFDAWQTQVASSARVPSAWEKLKLFFCFCDVVSRMSFMPRWTGNWREGFHKTGNIFPDLLQAK